LGFQNTSYLENNGLPQTERVSPYEEPFSTLKNYHKCAASTSSREMTTIAKHGAAAETELPLLKQVESAVKMLPLPTALHDYAVVEKITTSTTGRNISTTTNNAYSVSPGGDYAVLEQPTSQFPPMSASEKSFASNSFTNNDSVLEKSNCTLSTTPTSGLLPHSPPKLPRSGENSTLNLTESQCPGPDYAILEPPTPDNF